MHNNASNAVAALQDHVRRALIRINRFNAAPMSAHEAPLRKSTASIKVNGGHTLNSSIAKGDMMGFANGS